MNHLNRRDALLVTSGLLLLPLVKASAQNECTTDLTGLEGIDIESDQTPGFEHYHQLIIPVSSLINIPKEGITLNTSVMDQGSYDLEGLESFAKKNNLSLNALRHHNHEVFLSEETLKEIASGKENVEISVFSRKKDLFVHNFLVTAPPSALAQIKQFNKKLRKKND